MRGARTSDRASDENRAVTSAQRNLVLTTRSADSARTKNRHSDLPAPEQLGTRRYFDSEPGFTPSQASRTQSDRCERRAACGSARKSKHSKSFTRRYYGVITLSVSNAVPLALTRQISMGPGASPVVASKFSGPEVPSTSIDTPL